MKARWLLLAVSVICLLALFPAVALSQASRVDAGCGTATIDGYAGPAEWANAGRVEPFGWATNHASQAKVPIDLPEVDATQADEVSGELWVMNDATHFYMATTLTLDHLRLDPDFWMAFIYILFTDEGDALDGMWDALDCGPPPPGEGWVYNYDDSFGSGRVGAFIPESQAATVCTEPPLVGVQWEAAPGRSLVFEHSFDLNSSELDKVGPGDCFRVGLQVWGYGCEVGSDCATGGTWVIGEQTWPTDLDYTPSTFGIVCLDPCEVEFVPEPGTLALLGSGLAGLAGYATLRWRARE